MKSYSIRCYATDLSAHKKAERERAKMNISATTIYKDGLAFRVPKELHYANGKVKTAIYNMIKSNTVADMMKLGHMGVIIARVGVGEAV